MDFIWIFLLLIFFAIIWFYFSRWMVASLGQRKKKIKNNKYFIVGDSFAQPMGIYGSAVAPGQSSTAELNIKDTVVSSRSHDPGVNPIEERNKA